MNAEQSSAVCLACQTGDKPEAHPITGRLVHWSGNRTDFLFCPNDPLRFLRAYFSHELTESGYPIVWPAISVHVKEAAGWSCVRCGHPHDLPSRHVLTVHHLDGQKANCRWWNLPALCQRCHLHIQITVRMAQGFMFEHTEWFKPYAAGYYAFRFLGLELTRAEVEADLPRLLALQPHA